MMTSTNFEQLLERNKQQNRLDSISDQVNEISIVLDDLVDYSYGFNFKLQGIPEIQNDNRKQAIDTTKLCVQLFNSMGANVAITDIDIAHRVPSRNSVESSNPKPIICKFVRRLARQDIIALRNKVRNVGTITIGLDDQADLSNALIIDHLSPKKQDFLKEAKKFREHYKYAFCLAKDTIVYLRRYSYR